MKNEWIEISERFPTKDDADKHGRVDVKFENGITGSLRYGNVSNTKYKATHWRTKGEANDTD